MHENTMLSNFFKIQGGATAFYSALLELLPDVESFQNEVYNAQPLLSCADDRHSSQLEKLLNQLELLQSQVIQMKSDVIDLKQTIQMMLGNQGVGFGSLISATSVLKFESPDDGADNFENLCTQRNNEDSENQFIEQHQSQYGDQRNIKKAITYKVKVTNTTNSKSKKCYHCGQKINNRLHHMQRYHPGQKNFPCKNCGKEFDDYKEFQTHKKTHTDPSSLRCDLCNATLKSLRNMSQHMKSHLGEKSYICSVCGRGFMTRTSRSNCKHKLETGGDFMNQGSQVHCKLSQKVFPTADVVTAQLLGGQQSSAQEYFKVNFIAKQEEPHLSNNSSTKQIFHCTICPKTFSKQWRMKQHMNFHSGAKPFKCEFCYQTFHTSKAKGVHKYKKHSGKFQGFICKICGQKCKSGLGREAHYLTHTREELSLYNIVIKMAECDVCGKIVRRNYLTNHKLCHSSKDAFICEVCGKGFSRKANLKKHGIVHLKPSERPVLEPRLWKPQPNREKKYVCTVCGKAFANRIHLVIHNRTHTGEKPHMCDVCGKGFITAQALKHHEVVHTKVKAHKCKTCGESFTLLSNLKRHHLIHTGQKPYQCDFCGKSFFQKVHLENHRRIHTGEKPYQCSRCGKKFSDPSTLHKHRAKHEKELENNV
ncbi:zinc finger protein 420 [Elysia marginata]|uniref:Zinc finger protein 420 n=1 Tax=Elysia marginata TaxID=1093978 RepID=A0AAV4GJR3_9GAST|nr:zinc finger protein 420 [Elysia marginata]